MEQVADVCSVMLMFTGDCPAAIHTTLLPAVAALLSDTYEPVRTASRGIIIAALLRMLSPIERMAELSKWQALSFNRLTVRSHIHDRQAVD